MRNTSSTRSLSNDGWQNEKGLTDWSHKHPARPKASPSRSTAEGVRQGKQKKAKGLLMRLCGIGLSKPAGNVGQLNKNNQHGGG